MVIDDALWYRLQKLLPKPKGPQGNGIYWRMDETYIKVKGQWVYLYRAIDKEGKTVDFLLGLVCTSGLFCDN
jgi:transposase-like protein